LFAPDPFLAPVVLVLVVPGMLVLTLWFRGASDRTYGTVRDRIAEALADLSERLAGTRVGPPSNRRPHDVIHHRNVVGSYRDANIDTAKVGGIYGSTTEALGVIAQA